MGGEGEKGTILLHCTTKNLLYYTRVRARARARARARTRARTRARARARVRARARARTRARTRALAQETCLAQVYTTSHLLA